MTRVDRFTINLYNLFFEKGFLDLPRSVLDDACRIVEQIFGEDAKENLKAIGRDEFIEFVDKLIDQVDPVKQALRERMLKEQERSLREAAEHAAMQERRQREAAERKLAQLEELLASKGIGLVDRAQAAGAAAPLAGASRRRPIRHFAHQPAEQQEVAASVLPQRRMRDFRRELSEGEGAKEPPAKRQIPATRV